MEKMEENVNESRRSFLSTSGKALAGVALASGMLAQSRQASGYAYESDYKYVKLDPKKVGQIAYENYAKRWCASSVIAGFVAELQEKAGGSWKNYPIDSMRWAHGGFAGWGTLCGTMTGAGTIIGLVTNETDVAEAMCNDLAFYYSYTELPSFTPAKIGKTEIHNMTIAGTPICHISVGKFMRLEAVDFLSDARAERCARLAANIAQETTIMLNDWKDGKFQAKHKPLYNVLANGITSQNNCMDCHGHDVPGTDKYHSLDK
jgi:hypothetical protein